MCVFVETLLKISNGRISPEVRLEVKEVWESGATLYVMGQTCRNDTQTGKT